MTYFKRKGDKNKYSFSDVGCIGRECWAPGMFQHRSPMSGGGSRNTGSPDSPCCLNRAYRGCPSGPIGDHDEICPQCAGQCVLFNMETQEHDKCGFCFGHGAIKHQGLPLVNIELTKKRKSEGWKKA